MTLAQNTKKIFLIILLIIISINTLYCDIINQLSNKNLSISGYFFSSSKSSYFLRYINENNSSLWQYTIQRNFKPIHNAIAFDGYEKAENIFNITIDSNRSINISSIINNNNNNNNNNNSDSSDSSNSLHKDILNKTFLPTHLLLKDNSSKSNYSVLTNKDATSLW